RCGAARRRSSRGPRKVPVPGHPGPPLRLDRPAHGRARPPRVPGRFGRCRRRDVRPGRRLLPARHPGDAHAHGGPAVITTRYTAADQAVHLAFDGFRRRQRRFATDPWPPPSSPPSSSPSRRRSRRRGAILLSIVTLIVSTMSVVGPVRAANNDALSFGADQEPTGSFGANDVV